MLGTIVTVAILGGAGYLGWRLAKGGTSLKFNPSVLDERKARVAKRLLKQYSASAKRHLEKARKDNGLHIYGSPYGQFNVSYKDGVYTIRSKNDDTLNRVIAKGSSKEIVPVLVKLESDEWNAIPVEINIPLRGYRR